ncbi:hypothetical protein N0V95_007752 [Ascochyta clinopodiicola]|nr:hypothetical protein N0V95_007752 [Ascochyta clinopodiicola]
MGKVFFKDAGLTGGSTEEYYETIARYHAVRAAADREHETGYNNGKSKGQAGDEDVVNNNDSEYGYVTEKASRPTEDKDPVSEIIRTAGVAPKVQNEAITQLNKALRALNGKEKDTFEHAMGALMKLGSDMKVLARKTLEWVKAHPWDMAAIVILIILAVCTIAVLGGVEFTASGIPAAGKDGGHVDGGDNGDKAKQE